MADEFAGTERSAPGNGSAGGSGGDSAIDPATFAANSGGGNSSGGGTDDGFVYDAAGQPIYNKDGSRKRKRGRRAGSASGAPKEKASAADLKRSVEVLAGSLALVHTAIAGFTNTPEMALDPEEAKSLAEASAAVMREFDLQPDPKTQAIVGLVMVSATIYGPRMYLIRERKINEARAAQNGEGVVVNPDGSSTVTTFKAP